mmetsp:Transcript_4313/g.6803  ORF Transcript_4313/g.6803 Transcript_4313/m.6803 type:complete len:397 (-) Transcript_4313:312-1502(-)
MKAVLAATLFFSSLFQGFADHDANFDWGTLKVRIPKSLSDHTATLSEKDGLIYLAGGCDSPNGNEFAQGGDYFFCATISDMMYVFNPEDLTFGEPGTLPRERYRHCAAIVDNQLWLLGGRDSADNLVPEVDVYNIDTSEWSTYTLPEEYQTSDHACFTDSSALYVAGGYNISYGTLDTVFRLDTSSPSSTLAVEEMAPLSEARGDISAAFDGSTAYVAGGFTDANGFCAPVTTAEAYDIATNSWSYLPPLDNERGEIVMVALDDHLYAMGGERQIEGICELTGDTDPGELTVGLEIVESLENNSWTTVDSFDEHKFRFAAVGTDGLIFAFGGQENWDYDCECFRTTDEIQIIGYNVEEILKNEKPPESSSSSLFLISSCGVWACALVSGFLGYNIV